MDRTSASAALDDIAAAESRTGRAMIYGASATYLFLWGVLVFAGNLGTQFLPELARWIWPVTWLAGLIASALLTARDVKRVRDKSNIVRNAVLTFAALIGFGMLTLWLFSPVTPRQLNVFWPLIFMLCYVIAGIWVGRFFLICGLSVAALAVIGYLHAGPWLPLWMAVANGGALILGGFYLRRVGLRL